MQKHISQEVQALVLRDNNNPASGLPIKLTLALCACEEPPRIDVIFPGNVEIMASYYQEEFKVLCDGSQDDEDALPNQPGSRWYYFVVPGTKREYRLVIPIGKFQSFLQATNQISPIPLSDEDMDLELEALIAGHETP